MRRTIISILLVIAAATIAAAQEFRPMPGPPMRSLTETLKAAGNFKTLLSLIEKAGPKNLGLVPASGKVSPAQAGPGGGPRSYQTIFAPTDAAFAKLPPGALEALMKDPVRLRSFLLAHMVAGQVMIADLLTPVGDGTSKTYKELKSREGRVLGFQCNGHTGMHMPWINDKARVGRFQDVMASDYLIVIHEIDAVLMADGSVRADGPR